MGTSGAERQSDAANTVLGVFGGTFDPVHIGHLRIAIDAREALGLSEVRLVPLAHAVHRDQPETPAQLRLAMLRAAVQGRTGLAVDTCELTRKGPSYTVDTLEALRRAMPRRPLCLLLGSDAFNGFPAWHRPDSILQLANIALLRRPDIPLKNTVRPLYEQRRVERLDPACHGQIIDCPVAQLDVSSTDVRQRVSAGRSIDYLVPDPVLEIIRQHDLYRAPLPPG
jgi:nicotinate-nucleotide adenylyltransferase